MGRVKRKPFQGVTNIIRFNWHYYAIAFAAITILYFTKSLLPPALNTIATILITLAILSTLISLTVSWYVYDYSDLYILNWLDSLTPVRLTQVVNINAGFDETSLILAARYNATGLMIFDFYDPLKHTEISIERARKAYPAIPGTKAISTNNVPLQPNSVDCIFLIFAAHEIRNDEERILFFKQLESSLCRDGKIIVVEHQRDLYNFIAYNIGFFHFFSNSIWKKTFAKACLSVESEFKINPFVTSFILKKNAATT